MFVAVTGASGHLGCNLVRSLLDAGHSVRAAMREGSPTALEGLDLDRTRFDVLDPVSVRRAVDGAEVVFHLAARISIVATDAALVTRTNVEGPRILVAACLDAGVRRLVHTSSIHAHLHLPFDAPVDETRPLTDHFDASPYDRSKAAGQREVLAGARRGLDAVIVNPTGVIGPNDWRPSRMGRFFLDVRSGRVPAVVDGGFDWVDVRDVAAGTIAAAERGRTGQGYLLSGRWVHLRELAAMAGARRWVCPMWLARMAAPASELGARWFGVDPLFTPIALHALRHHRDVHGDKARRELGYSSRPTEDTVADTLAWFDARGLR